MSQPPPNFPPPPGFPPPGPPPQGSGSGSNRTLLWVSIVAVVAVLAVAAVLVAVLVTRGDDGDDDKDRDAREDRSSTSTDANSASAGPTEASSAMIEPTEASSATTSAAPVDITNAELDGQWYGRYRCAQGASAGRLRITAVEGSTSELTAVFRFGASTNNAGTPPGAYRLDGEVVDGIMTLRAGDWIERPDGYISVDMIAIITDPAPDVLDGEVNYAGCSTFHFERK
ncbi:hypothetical protein ACFQ0K_04045 [Nocardioides caeni]|uniref:Uncharacterized protein n=1 Tax=Nocardioides caeni TaxID=574700 RepID=A0A4S8N2M6_9ACTN|nr:hypothetical protein [Nocardioides caeni]THV09024.1 hypothetical protein E9934_17700 [Nocardioides caeni]